jgi:hypothetical protein
MYPHRIRLRGPWECEAPLGADPRRIHLPCRWEQLVPPAYRGSVRLVRRFGYPGRLDAFEHVWLSCTGVTAQAAVALNGQSLGTAPSGSFEYDVTSRLGPRNHLEVLLVAETTAGPVWEEVALEIRRAAFLRAAARRTGQDGVEVRGVVVGTASHPLELYALVGGRNAHYQLVDADPAGRPFQFTLTGVDPACATVQLDLVHIATSWYALELPIEQ